MPSRSRQNCTHPASTQGSRAASRIYIGMVHGHGACRRLYTVSRLYRSDTTLSRLGASGADTPRSRLPAPLPQPPATRSPQARQARQARALSLSLSLSLSPNTRVVRTSTCPLVELRESTSVTVFTTGGHTLVSSAPRPHVLHSLSTHTHYALAARKPPPTEATTNGSHHQRKPPASVEGPHARSHDAHRSSSQYP